MNSQSSKKPSLVTARACVLIFQAFQLFSSSVQFCGLSRLPCPCRPESHKRNTCELASASCSLCRSTLPCRQVRRVTNIYVLSFCVLLIFFPYSKQFCYFRFTRRPYCLFIIVCYRSTVRTTVWKLSSFKAVMAGIAKVVVQVIFTPISKISSNAIMVGSSLPVSFINPV